MMCIEHGTYPKDELVPLTTLYLSKSGTGNLWGRLTDSVRVFIFPGVSGIKKARFALMNRGDITFSTVCEMDEDGDGWTGMVGLGWVKAKRNPDWKGARSWGLYISPRRKG